MMTDHDEAWLLEMATGAADGTVQIQSPNRNAGPQGEPIVAPFVSALRDEDLQRQVAEREMVDLQLGSPEGGIEHIDLEADDVEVQLDTGGRQKAIATPNVPPRTKKRKHAEGDAGHKSRKHRSGSRRSGSSRRHKSLPIEEGFAKRSYEEYVADPVAAMVHTSLHLGELVKLERNHCEARVKEMQGEREKEKNLKEKAMKDLLVARDKLNETNNSLTSLRGDLKVLEKARDDLAKEKTDGLAMISTLREEIRSLEEKEKALKEEVQRLTLRVAELEGEVRDISSAAASGSDPGGRVAELEKLLNIKNAELAASNERVKKTAQYALLMKERGFNTAMDQVLLVNPGMRTFAGCVIHPSHVVEGEKIVKTDQRTKEKTIIYPAPAH